MSAPQATDELVAPPPTEPGRLHRPGRALVALAELVVAGAAVWGAFWAWPQGFATISTVVADGVALDSQRVYGNWLALAILFGTVAAVLVLDALRQTVLAVRARPNRAKKANEADAVPDPKVTGDD